MVQGKALFLLVKTGGSDGFALPRSRRLHTDFVAWVSVLLLRGRCRSVSAADPARRLAHRLAFRTRSHSWRSPSFPRG
ncbi:hypothetical protein BOS5A_231304 [Bosea sp. EC-HK365B]|nr:hypothetical protein BOSE7B_50122 [Bosea sp. 7B]CAD5300335.1 hypothetical protein BOSE21B_91376 [Bosea sp. 21B]VVT62037.1 hypothetical protein BOS5A_231304 [Bosea sp. EC-HK365B]VXC97480.1 hypothetical protein BOSE127_90122 [Bosea sp. 127]